MSACVTDRTDAASLYRREVSREWWATQSSRHDMFVSAEVLAELSAPVYGSSRLALEWVRDVPILALDDDIRGLARIFVREKVMPGPLAGDAIHLAAACLHEMEYLLSWNVRHLANLNKLEHLRKVCLRLGVLPPRIVTPDLLSETDDDGQRNP